jgi:hypothetical protein
MTGGHYQGLLGSHDFQVTFDQVVLHPVLADLAGFPIGDQFVRIERHIQSRLLSIITWNALPSMQAPLY